MLNVSAQPRPPANDLLVDFLVAAVPGSCARVARYRADLLDFAATPTERTLFLTSAGPEAAAAARMVALLRTAMMLKPEAATRILDGVQLAPGGLADFRQLAGAFAELDASALREADALKELLGEVSSIGVRPGLFERAMFLQGRQAETVALTGGFVHLAEPAELPETLQGIFAGVCAGARFSRVGDTEEQEDFLVFEGVAICSTSKGRAADGLRSDFADRLVGREIAIPRLSELMPDFAVQVRVALDQLRREYDRFYDRAKLSNMAARDFWAANRPPQNLPAKVREQLAKVDWAENGEGAGLRSVIRAIVAGTPPGIAIAGLAPAIRAERQDLVDTRLRRLEALDCDEGTKLAGRLRLLEVEDRAELKDRLRGDAAAAIRLARKLGVTIAEFKDQLAQLDRVRPAGKGDKQ